MCSAACEHMIIDPTKLITDALNMLRMDHFYITCGPCAVL